jgi:predicted phosphodiesterase
MNKTYVLISDIHANLPALEAVLSDIAKGQHSGVYHLGDLVGYMSSPNEVVKDRPDSFLAKMAGQAGAREGDVICFGHTHKPWHRVVNGIHFVNTGSVGRPKDGDPRACYVAVDMSGPEPVVGFFRVAYDIGSAVKGIEDNGLPREFADHLRTGGRKA